MKWAGAHTCVNTHKHIYTWRADANQRTRTHEPECRCTLEDAHTHRCANGDGEEAGRDESAARGRRVPRWALLDIAHVRLRRRRRHGAPGHIRV